MPSMWRRLERMVDSRADRVWGEPVELHPYKPGDAINEASPDASRGVVYTRGVFMMPGSATTGEGAGAGSSGVDMKTVTNQMWVSITERNLPNLHTWTPEDRVYLPERDDWYQFSYIQPSATGRPNIYLTRLQDDAP